MAAPHFGQRGGPGGPGGGGTVTSVGLVLPSELTVTVSPITTTGDLTAVWATEVANSVFAGPATGIPATPTFRALVATDLPLPLDHHADLTNFTANDDHTQYALLAGRAAFAQTLIGRAGAPGSLVLDSSDQTTAAEIQLVDTSIIFQPNLSDNTTTITIAGGVAEFANYSISVGNNDNTARYIEWHEASGSGLNYTRLQAQAQTSNISYKFPAAAPTTNAQALVSTTAGVWSWVDASSISGAITLPLDHHANLTNFTANDDHTQYLLLAGRAGSANNPTLSTTTDGAILGSSAAGFDLRLNSGTPSQPGTITLMDTLSTTTPVQAPNNTFEYLHGGRTDGAAVVLFAVDPFDPQPIFNILGHTIADSYILGANNGTPHGGASYRFLDLGVNPTGVPTWSASADGPSTFDHFGLNLSHILVSDNQTLNLSFWTGVYDHSVYEGTMGTTVDERRFIDDLPTIQSGSRILTRIGYSFSQHLGSGTLGSAVAVAVDDQIVASGAAAVLSHMTAGSGKYNFQCLANAPSIHPGTWRFGDTTIATQPVEILGNVLLDNAGTAAQLRFREPSASGANYTAFQAQAQAADITYTLPPSITTNGYLKTSVAGSLTWALVSASEIQSGAALTKTDDTNVTLTLGGTPASALLAATSLTLGWTGTLGLARGGTNANLAATGGTSQVLRQSSTGAAVTVSQLAITDISGTSGLGIAGDVTGTLAASTVAKINGVAYNADPLAQYTKLAGRTSTTNDTILSTDADGTLSGSAASAGNLVVQSTTHATKGKVKLADAGLLLTSTSTVSAAVAALGLTQALTLDNNASQVDIIDVTGTWTASAGLVNQHRLFSITPTATNSGSNAIIPGFIIVDFRPSFTTTVATTFSTSTGINFTPTFDVSGAGTWATTRAITAFQSGATVNSGTGGTRKGFNHVASAGAGTFATDIAVDVGALAGGTLNCAVRSAIAASAGKSYCIRDTGGADSIFKGQVRFGDTTDPTALVDIVGKTLWNTSGLQTKYNNFTTAGNGHPIIVGVVDLTAQAAAQTTATLATPPVAGMYRVSFAITLTRAATNSSTVGAGVNLNYTTGDGATALVQNVPMWVIGATTATTDSGSAANTVGTTLIGAVTVYSSTTAMTFDVGYTSSGVTTMQYACRVRVELI